MGAGKGRLLHGLIRVPAYPRHTQERHQPVLIQPCEFVTGQFQQRPVESGIPNGELGGMYAHRDSSSPGGGIVSPQGALASFIKASFRVKRQGAGRNNHPVS